MQNFQIVLAYDGTDFAGWQRQKGQRTVQQDLEQALTKIAGTPVDVLASGRTDAGVHALAQVASFFMETAMPAARLAQAINGNLRQDLRVLAAGAMPSDFHARRDAVSKTYRYVFDLGQEPNVFLRRHAWHLRPPLSVAAMHAAAQALLGTHDFKSFEAVGAPRKSTVRTVSAISVLPAEHAPGQVWLEITSDGFLYHMVRNIAGALVAIGKRKYPPEWLQTLLVAKDRKLAPYMAPAQGLFLLRVQYAAALMLSHAPACMPGLGTGR